AEQLADGVQGQCEGVAAAHLLVLPDHKLIVSTRSPGVHLRFIRSPPVLRRHGVDGSVNMDGTATAALQHIQLMETRIEQQTALITTLRQSGGDTLEAARRLVLLRNALEEMRIQLGGLLPTEVQDRLKSAR